MKTTKIYFAILAVGFLVLHTSLTSQDIYAYKFIGKPRTDVVKKYGKPVHIDNTDPSMVCMFYKNKQDRMVFVSDQQSVYQVEATKAYASESSAMNDLQKLLAEAANENFKIDTLSVSEYRFLKEGVDFNAVLMHNQNFSQYEVRVKGVRR